jgi:hypothetical protein
MKRRPLESGAAINVPLEEIPTSTVPVGCDAHVVSIDLDTVEPRYLRELADLIEARRQERADARFDSVWAEWEAQVASRADPATTAALDQLGDPDADR